MCDVSYSVQQQSVAPMTNLVSSDGVMMDQRTLVFRSTPVTEASKRLEQQIDVCLHTLKANRIG